jgi:hypothetical protein
LGTNFGKIGEDKLRQGGTNFGKGDKLWQKSDQKRLKLKGRGQTLAKSSVIRGDKLWQRGQTLVEGTNFGSGDKLWQKGQTLAEGTNFCTKYLVIEVTNFCKKQIKIGRDTARRDKLWQK